MKHILHRRRLVVVVTGVVAFGIIVVVVFVTKSLSRNDDDGSLPQVTLTAAGDAVLRDSRKADPDIFGEPLRALATLDEYEAKLAIMYSEGDMETAAASALFWSMTPEDVRQRTSEFIEVISQAERLYENIKADASLDQSHLKPRLKRLVAWLGVCNQIVVTESPAYDSLMPRMAALGRDVINSGIDSKRMLEPAAHLLYELERRSWLDPEGQAALDSAYAANPNLPILFRRWSEQPEPDGFLNR